LRSVKSENWLYSEEYRHQCDVRWLLKVRLEQGLHGFRRYVEVSGLYKRWPKVEKDFNAQWRKGNRGNNNDWKK